MGRNSCNTGIKKKYQRTGKLQFYAPHIREEINSNVAIIEGSP
jgi:hypothetical protein